MKKNIILCFMFAFIFFVFINKAQVVFASSNIKNDIYPLVSATSANVSCDASFCGLKINPNVDTNSYSFEYKNARKNGNYTKGVYVLQASTTLTHTYQYRKVSVVTQNNVTDYDLSGHSFSVDLFFESNESFYLLFEYKVSTIKYVSGSPSIDQFKNFSLTKTDTSEDVLIYKINVGSLWSINEHIPSIITDAKSNKIYSFALYNKTYNNYYPSGEYNLSFDYNLESCGENCSSYEYQKIKIITMNNTFEHLLTYYGKDKFNFDFQVEENFYIEIENKISYEQINNYPIDTFSNICIQNTKKQNTFISLVESAGLYTINNKTKNYTLSPNTNKFYKFVISNGLANRKYDPGLYNLSFAYSLNSCKNNCDQYEYQKIKIVTTTQTYEHEVSYSLSNFFEFEFTINDYFYILIENKVNFIRIDDYPLDVFNTIKLFKTAQITDFNSPTFSEYQGVYISNVDSPVIVETIKGYLTAFDETDGDITHKIILKEDNFTSNNNNLGLYDVVFCVTDSSYNEGCIIIKVNVIDITPPVISGDNILLCSIKNGCFIDDEEITISNINKLFVITDNIDQDLIYNIVENTWSNQEKSTNNTYKLTINSFDLSSNKSENFTITITYIDDIKAIIVSGGEFHTGISKFLTLQLIKENILVSDNFDGTNQIESKTSSLLFDLKEDNYTSNQNQVGTYEIIFTYKSIDYLIIINVYDNLPPIFYIEEQIIHIDVFNTLNHNQIIDLLKSLNLINEEPLNVNFILDEYSPNSSKKGSYNLSISVDYADNTNQVIDLLIITHGPNDNEGLFKKQYIIVLSLIVTLLSLAIIYLFKKKKIIFFKK